MDEKNMPTVVNDGSDGNPIIVTEQVDPIIVEIEIKPDDWEPCGSCWRCVKDAGELYDDGITNAYLNEEKMKEVSENMSYTMKAISDIYSEDTFDPVMNAKTEDRHIIFDWNRKEKPIVTIIFTVEQLPFY